MRLVDEMNAYAQWHTNKPTECPLFCVLPEQLAFYEVSSATLCTRPTKATGASVELELAAEPLGSRDSIDYMSKRLGRFGRGCTLGKLCCSFRRLGKQFACAFPVSATSFLSTFVFVSGQCWREIYIYMYIWRQWSRSQMSFRIKGAPSCSSATETCGYNWLL